MTSVLERTRYVCDDTVMSVLLIEDVLEYDSVDHYSGGPVREVLDRKRTDPWYPELVKSLKENGFTKGIRIHPTVSEVTDGHHRIAAAIDLGWKYIPVESNYGAEYNDPWQQRYRNHGGVSDEGSHCDCYLCA